MIDTDVRLNKDLWRLNWTVFNYMLGFILLLRNEEDMDIQFQTEILSDTSLLQTAIKCKGVSHILLIHLSFCACSVPTEVKA